MEDLAVAARPATRTDIFTANVDGRLVVLDADRRLVHELDATTSAVWPLLDGTSTVADLAADVGAVFHRAPGEVLPDLLELVRRLGAANLLAGGEPEVRSVGPLGYLTDPPAP